MKKRLFLKGWRLFIGTISVGYPLFFGLLWTQQTEKPFAGAVVHYGLTISSVSSASRKDPNCRGGGDMRIVNILSGLAVLFTTLAFGHLLHRYFVNAGEAAHSPPFLAGMAIGIVVGTLSLIGGCLLLRRGR